MQRNAPVVARDCVCSSLRLICSYSIISICSYGCIQLVSDPNQSYAVPYQMFVNMVPDHSFKKRVERGYLFLQIGTSVLLHTYMTHFK